MCAMCVCVCVWLVRARALHRNMCACGVAPKQVRGAHTFDVHLSCE